MKSNSRSLNTCALLAFAVFAATRPLSAFGDDIGVDQLHLEVPNLLGQGVVVAQPEGNSSASSLSFEISPADAKITVPVTYVYADGGNLVQTTTMNSNYVSWHAYTVANYLAGTDIGVAPNLARIYNYDADLYVNYYVLRNIALGAFPALPKVITQSFVETTDDTIFSPQILNQFFDNYVAVRKYVMVTAAGNGGDVLPPGTAYNVITVGSYQGATSVSQPGQLSKPDIVAPAYATSFATPRVSGVAALLVQAAGSGDGIDPRTIKAVLLTGATKPQGWTHTTDVPLDRSFGAGIVNAYSSYKILTGGEYGASSTSSTANLGGSHPAIGTGAGVGAMGWNLRSITSTANSDAVDHYVIDLSQSTSVVTLTATLTWLRANDQALTNEFLANANNPNFSNFTSSIYTINNLDMYLYNAGNQQQMGASLSAIDNVEHIYTINLTPGKYDLQVLKNGGATGSANVFSQNETYAVAWNTAAQSNVANTSALVFNSSVSTLTTSTITGSGSLIISGAGTVNLSNYSGTGPIVVNSGRLVLGATATPNTRSTIAASLSIGRAGNVWTGTVDIGNNPLIIKAPAGGPEAQLQAQQVASLIHAGLNAEGETVYSGTGITSSTAADYDNSTGVLLYGVGWIQNNSATVGVGDGTTANMTGNPILTTFGEDNVPVALNDVLIRFTYVGDADLNGIIDATDYFLINAGYSSGASGWINGDFDGNGVVDATDYFLINSAFAAQSGPLTGGFEFINAVSGSPAGVPEPGSVLMLLAGTAGLAFRRRSGAGRGRN